VGIKESYLYSRNHVGFLRSQRPGVANEKQNDEAVEAKQPVIWFKPCDTRIPLMEIPAQLIPSEITKNLQELESTLFVSKIHSWKRKYPRGNYIGKLGQIGELATESEALLVSAGIYWEEFSEKVLNSLVPTPWSIPEEELQNREDLRGLRIFSIDPPTARDLDDALSCRAIGDGSFEVGVHIADVSFFVPPGGPLDDEAYNRATSVYLCQKVIPMLPRLLCEELCSLNAGVDRLAFSVFWVFDENANVISGPRFSRTIINSCAKLWYDHCQAVIEGQDWNDVSKVELAGGWSDSEVQADIRQLFKYSQIMRKRRYENGALSLSSIKLWFSLDEVGNPTNAGIYQLKDSNRMIEEVCFILYSLCCLLIWLSPNK
jgi:protein SSD1